MPGVKNYLREKQPALLALSTVEMSLSNGYICQTKKLFFHIFDSEYAPADTGIGTVSGTCTGVPGCGGNAALMKSGEDRRRAAVTSPPVVRLPVIVPST